MKKLLFPSIALFAFVIFYFDFLEEESDAEGVLLQQEEQVLVNGKKMAGLLNKTLISNLTQAIEKEGLEGAIEFCSLNALPITDSVSAMSGVHISRVSHRPRNATNAANAEELQIISDYLNKSDEEKKKPVVITQNNKTTFYAPIYIPSPLCLNCHGTPASQIAPKVHELIRQKYPTDQATDFAMGDFRGMVKVEFEALDD